MVKVKRSHVSFSINQALEFGWKKFTSNIGLFLLLDSFAVLLVLSPYILQSVVQQHDYATPIMIRIGIYIAQMILSLGNLTIALILYEKKKTHIGKIFSSISLLPKYIGAYTLEVLIVIGGYLLFIIPGIIWSIYFEFAVFLVIEKKLGPIQALKRSAVLTKGNRMKLFLFNIIFFLINFVGALCFLVGLAVTVPVTLMAKAYIYKQLSSRT